MSRFKRRIAGIVVATSLLGAAPAVAPASPIAVGVQPETVVAAKACSAGYRHGIIGGAHKCLRAGQFCATRYDRSYHRYSFHCHTGRLRAA